MPETTAEYHYLLLAFASAKKIIADLPLHRIDDDLQSLKLKSFVFLSHAAIEEYLEKVSMYVLRECKKALVEESKVRKPLALACSFYGVSLKKRRPSIVDEVGILDFFQALSDEILGCHENAIAEVHGIKTKDQDALLVPIGLRVHDFDHVLSQTLNSLGEGRGTIAHLFRIQQQLPRAACESQVDNISKLLLPLDQELARLVLLEYEMPK